MSTVESKRLTCRLSQGSDEDAVLLFELDQDVEVMRYINGGRITTPDEFEKTYIPRMQAYTNPDRGWGLWLVKTRTDQEFLGWILVRPADFFTEERNDRRLEIGWRFKRDAWGKGYATESAQTVVDYLESLGDCDSFYAYAMVDNAASVRVMEKLGLNFDRFDDIDSWMEPGEKIACVFYERPCTG